MPSERTVFTLNTAVMAAAEAALGRMGRGQLQRYTSANARLQLDPSAWEVPGMMPEIAPSPDFDANIDRLFTERSMALQAWGTYGVLWPVVHFQLGISPDLGRRRVTGVPQVPSGQHRVAGRNVRLGKGSVSVAAVRGRGALRTTVSQTRRWALVIGVVLPPRARVRSVLVDGRRSPYRVVATARGREVRAAGGGAAGRTSLVVRVR